MSENNTFKCTIDEEIGVLGVSSNGWRKEVNIVRWGDKGTPKLDIRSFAPGRASIGKGISLSEGEAKTLYALLKKIYEE